MNKKIVKLFLRLTIAIGFLSAVADRFGFWNEKNSVWGNWDRFVEYTQVVNPWFPNAFIEAVAIIATGAEVVFALCLLIGYKTELFARLSGVLLLIFGLAMALSTGIKGPLDYSVFTASAAAFALGMIKEKYLEIDSMLENGR
jgi:thiosulfate dehydrogenase (quinone) large subunit